MTSLLIGLGYFFTVVFVVGVVKEMSDDLAYGIVLGLFWPALVVMAALVVVLFIPVAVLYCLGQLVGDWLEGFWRKVKDKIPW